MSTADDDVLTTDGGPDDANTRAEFAVLDMALRERFGDRAPRDLWPGTAARLLRARSAAPARMQPWLLAAGMLLGLGVVTAMALWRPGSAPEAPMSPAPEPRDPPAGLSDGPMTLAELQAQFAAAETIQLKTHAVWSAALDRWVLVRSPAFVDSTGSSLGPELANSIATSIAGAQTAPGETAMPQWSHRLTAGRAELLLRLRDEDPPKVGWIAPQGAVTLQVTDFPFAALLPVATATTSGTISKMGMVLGAAGFAAMPKTVKKLQLHDVPAAAIRELAKFPELRSLDLTQAPAWHDATVLQGLERHHLAELALLPDQLDPSAYRALGHLATLRKLWLAGQELDALMRYRRPHTPAASLDDDAMQALARLQRVTQLTIAGGRFTDEGLRALRTMQLKTLALLDCDGVRGESFAELRLVRHLIVRGGPLANSAASQLAMMPALREMWLQGEAASIALNPLAASNLSKIGLEGTLHPDALPNLHRIASLRDLMLRPTTPLTDEDLLWLHSLRQLDSLNVVGASEAQLAALRRALPGVQVLNAPW
jgi:hypothetical protein